MVSSTKSSNHFWESFGETSGLILSLLLCAFVLMLTLGALHQDVGFLACCGIIFVVNMVTNFAARK
jgi:hypothetical protein